MLPLRQYGFDVEFRKLAHGARGARGFSAPAQPRRDTPGGDVPGVGVQPADRGDAEGQPPVAGQFDDLPLGHAQDGGQPAEANRSSPAAHRRLTRVGRSSPIGLIHKVFRPRFS
jgi:hypothetical protein